MTRSLVLLAALGAGAVTAARAEEPSLRLRVAQVSQLPADVPFRLPIKLTITNTGQSPVHLIPSLSDVSGSLDVFVRQVGTDAPAAQLFSVASSGGCCYDLADLFALMPGRSLRQTIWVAHEPLFSGEGAVEIWAEYDASRSGTDAATAFSGRLTSVPIVVPVRLRVLSGR